VTTPRTATPRTELDLAFAALRRDLVHPDGPRISTMRNYRYAIVPYDPVDEFKLRERVRELVGDLTSAGWVILTLSLAQAPSAPPARPGRRPGRSRMIEAERAAAAASPERGINYLRTKFGRELDGAERHRRRRLARDPGVHRRPPRQGRAHRGVHRPRRRALPVLPQLGPAQAPRRARPATSRSCSCTRASAAARPGLSFMGELDPDRDYRPRIYSLSRT
jgi:hypothetical protein